MASLAANQSPLMSSTDHHEPDQTEPVEQPEHQYVDVKVAMTHDAISPGQTVLVGLTLFIEKNWHTYWPGASDSGFGVTLETTAPDVLLIGEPIWPTPQRYLSPGDILDHVYEDHFTVLIPITLADDAVEGTPIPITTDISYLVCKEVCLPGSVSIEYGLYAVDPGSEATLRTPQHHDRLNMIYDQRPRPLQSTRQDSAITISEASAQIHIPGATALMFYPSATCVELPSLITEGRVGGDTITLSFDPAEGGLLEGRIEVLDHHNKSQSYTIRIPAVAE